MESWNNFFVEKITKIFLEKNQVIDIGGGLRINKDKNNRFDKSNIFVNKLIKNDKHYLILDKLPDYNPDIIGDIHNLPFPENSIESIVCIAVLEHVENPWLAAKEMYRVLKPGGYLYVFVPFLYYYHPMEGYYKDFYRFTRDGCQELFRDFSNIEITNVRGSFATIFRLLPILNRYSDNLFNVVDKIFKKNKSNQTSGYNIFCIK